MSGKVSRTSWFIGALILLGLTACSQDGGQETASPAAPEAAGPQAREIADGMLQALGGQEALEAVDYMVSTGGGIRNHLGQIPETGGEDPQATLREVTEVIDFQERRAAWDNIVQVGGGFSQHRTEAYTTYQDQYLGWGTTEGRPNIVTSVNGLFSWSTHDTPQLLLRRNPVTIALAARNASGQAGETVLDGESYWALPTTLADEEITLLIDKETSLLHGFTAIDTERMRGDQEATYVYSDYRPVDGLVLPHAVEIRHGEGVFSSLQYDSITLNDPSVLGIFDIPEDAIEQADQVLAMNGEAWVPLEWVEVAENVHHIVAFSHHSMVVEFPGYVVVVEGPYTEGQSLTLARQVEERLGKPIRYVIPTHPHYDHTGGLRGLASTGAAVLAAEGHEDEIRLIIESPHTNPADALARNAANGNEVGHVEVFSGMTEISDGDQRLELYELDNINHVKPFTLAYVPSAQVIFQSDLFFGAPGPDAAALYEAVQEHGLEVEQIVGGHGGVLPFSALEEAAGGGN